VRLAQISCVERDAILGGDLASLGSAGVAAGWPHEDTASALSFLDSGGLAFLVLDDDDRVAGECGTKAAPDQRGAVEIGYGLAGGSRGQGLGGSAVAALLDELWARPDVRIVEAEVHVGNPASWRLLERLGFTAYGEPDRGFQRYQLTRSQ
jgi:RimJ/RimL family protein N-acetyltransferase